MSETRPLRYWWAAPALAIAIMLGAWAWAERPRIDAPVDTRFLIEPTMTLAQREGGNDAWLAVDWRSRHNGLVEYSEMDILVDGAARSYVGRDPAPGEWSALRGDLYLSRDAGVREGDIIVIGSDGGLAGSYVRVIVDPCDCEAGALRLR